MDAGELWCLSWRISHNTDWTRFSGRLYLHESWIKADLPAARVLWWPSKRAIHILCSEYVGVNVLGSVSEARHFKIRCHTAIIKSNPNSYSVLPIMVSSKVFSSSYWSLKYQSLAKTLGSLEPIRFLFHRVFNQSWNFRTMGTEQGKRQERWKATTFFHLQNSSSYDVSNSKPPEKIIQKHKLKKKKRDKDLSY